MGAVVETGAASIAAVAKVRWEGLSFGGGREELSNCTDASGNEYSLSPWFQGFSPGTVSSWRLVEAAAFVEMPPKGGRGAKWATPSEASTLSQMF